MSDPFKVRIVRSPRGCFYRATDPNGMILATADTEDKCREKARYQLEVLAALGKPEDRS